MVIAVTDGTHGEPVEKFVFGRPDRAPPIGRRRPGRRAHAVADAVESTGRTWRLYWRAWRYWTRSCPLSERTRRGGCCCGCARG